MLMKKINVRCTYVSQNLNNIVWVVNIYTFDGELYIFKIHILCNHENMWLADRL